MSLHFDILLGDDIQSSAALQGTMVCTRPRVNILVLVLPCDVNASQFSRFDVFNAVLNWNIADLGKLQRDVFPQ